MSAHLETAWIPREGAEADAGHDAQAPGQVPAHGWGAVLLRVWRALGRDHIWVAAAGLAFCSLFAAIPGIAFVVVGLGHIGKVSLLPDQLAAAAGLLPQEVSRFLTEQLQTILPASRLHLTAALVTALWGARTAASTLISVLNISYRERERRGLLRYQLTVLAVTAALCLFGLLALVLITVAPLLVAGPRWSPLLMSVVWFGRWPALAGLMALALATIYRIGPCRSPPKWRWVAPGAGLATALWLAGSAVFSAYVARFASYDETFGALGAVMLLMTWFYLTAFAVLLGAELNAELERQTARDTTYGPERPLGQRGARMADIVVEHRH